jgi:hypothetical protein
MESQMMFLDCPAYCDEDGSLRCDLPAEMEYRYTQGSTGAQLESAKIRCPRGHWFNGPIEFFTWKSTERGASQSMITPSARTMISLWRICGGRSACLSKTAAALCRTASSMS